MIWFEKSLPMKKLKPHLFFDFDGLKFNTMPAQIDYINKTYGIQSVITDYSNCSKFEDVIKKYLPHANDITRDSVYTDLGKNFHTSIEHHENVEPFPAMCEVMRDLSEHYTLWTLTARLDCGIHVIKHLNNKHIPGHIYDVHCVHTEIDGVILAGLSKREFIESIPGEKIAFIDDSMHEILETKDIIPSYLFDPFRIHGKAPKGCYFVRDWYEIGEEFL